jgi:adenylate cyclase
VLTVLEKHLARMIIGLVVVAVFLAHVIELGGLRLPLLANLEAIVYDTRLRLTMPQTVDPRIVILDIDEKSLAEREQGGEGRWPWPRDRLALLMDKLFDRYEIAVVGFDIVFSERDESSGIRVLERLSERELRDVSQFQSILRRLKPQLEYDDIFARKIQGRPVVMGYVLLGEDSAAVQKKGMLPAPILSSKSFEGRTVATTSWGGYTANLNVLQKVAAGGGHINARTDDDGIIRRVPMLAEHGGAYYEPLSLAMVRVLLGSPPVKALAPGAGFGAGHARSELEWLQVGSLLIPVDEEACALVPYRGRTGSFKYFSIVDVMNERIDPAELRGKIVLVGTTAPGLLDLRATPVDPVYPGVEVHANMISGMLDGNIKQRPPFVVGAEFVLLLASGVAMALVLPLLTPLTSTLATLLVLAAALATNVMMLQHGDLVLPLASGLVMILLLFTLNMAYGFFVEARGMRQITGLFGQYVPPELVDEMARDPEKYNMKPRAAELTILFSDVRDFTSISEALQPEELREYINEYLTEMSAIIRNRHRGTLDKYMGDAIMAFWGAPVADPQHARNGVLAALDMQKECRILNEKFAARGWPTLKIGVGVNSGSVRVGDMGSKVRRAYTAMGDVVNVASRLEGVTKRYGADIIIGDGTRKLISGFVLREVDRVRVKGKEEPVTIYEPLGLEGQVEQAKQDEINIWNQALRLYRQQEWDRAEVQLLNLRKMAPDGELYGLFIERIAHHRAHPPGEGWDGAWTFETK